MKSKLCVLSALLALALSGFAVHAAAAEKSPAKPDGTNAAPAAVVAQIPQSNFSNPTNAQSGRDPFYPKSARPWQTAAVATTNVAAPVREPGQVSIKAILGTAEDRLVMINNEVFRKGQKSDVHTSSGRVSVECIDILEDETGITVVLEINGQRRELKRSFDK